MCGVAIQGRWKTPVGGPRRFAVSRWTGFAGLLLFCVAVGIAGGAAVAQGRQTVVIDPAHVPPVGGVPGRANRMIFVGYEGRMPIWEGELPVLGAPVRLMLDGHGGGIVTIVNPRNGTAHSMGISVPAQEHGFAAGPAARASGTVTVETVFLGKSSDGKLMFGVVVNGRIVEILFVDPQTGKVVKHINT